MTIEKTEKSLAKELETQLFDRHGPLISGEELSKALGYPSKDAFRQALVRKTVPIYIFTPEKRKGKFALVKDLAKWLAKQRYQTSNKDLQLRGDGK